MSHLGQVCPYRLKVCDFIKCWNVRSHWSVTCQISKIFQEKLSKMLSQQQDTSYCYLLKLIIIFLKIKKYSPKIYKMIKTGKIYLWDRNCKIYFLIFVLSEGRIPLNSSGATIFYPWLGNLLLHLTQFRTFIKCSDLIFQKDISYLDRGSRKRRHLILSVPKIVKLGNVLLVQG